MVTLNLKANLDFTGDAMDFVEAELERHDIPDTLLPEILIAVEEIFVNIASYAYNPDEKGDVTLSVTVDEKAVIRFEDSGEPFNPLESNDPDFGIPVIDRKIGGLGISFVKKLMDKVEYEYVNAKNVLTITKKVFKPGEVEENVY